MTEYSAILSHNILDGARLEGNDISGHELERLRDGYRHTWWESPSSAAQTITITAKSLLENPDFEVDLTGWWEYKGGAGAGTASRNTTSPIAGDADLKCIVTTADDATDIYSMIAKKPLFLRAGKTYKMAFLCYASIANVSIRYGFLDEDFTEDAALYDEGQAGVATATFYKNITPSVDGWYHPYIRIMEAATVYIDDVICNEVRAIDTLIIDGGHTLRFASIQVKYDLGVATPGTVAYATTVNYKDESLYITFAGISALKWAVVITTSATVPSVPVAKIPLMFLGKRWTLPRVLSNPLDPYKSEIKYDDGVADSGVGIRAYKYKKRVMKATLEHITPDEFAEVDNFYKDTNDGFKPFCFIFQPTTDPTDILILKMKGGRSEDYRYWNRRSFEIDADEVVGRIYI